MYKLSGKYVRFFQAGGNYALNESGVFIHYYDWSHYLLVGSCHFLN